MVVMEGRRRREGTERVPLAGKRLLGPVVSSAPPYNSRKRDPSMYKRIKDKDEGRKRESKK